MSLLIKKFNSQIIFFIVIFFLASIFRITNLNLIEFKTDEAINLLIASRPLFGHPFAPGGTLSSIGILNPPLFTYLLFPFTVISLDPRWISFVIGFVNSLAIAFLFLIIKKYYNQTIAIITTILMALSPWAIIYSRKIWTQDLLIPFFVPYFYCFQKLITEKKQIFWIPYTILALILIQLHQISIIFVGILTLFIFFQKIKINIKYIAIGIIIGIIPLIPFVAFELENNCPDCKAFIQAKNKLSYQRSFELFLRPLQITSQGDFRYILGNDTLTFSQKFTLVDKFRKIFYLEYLLLPLGIFIFIKKFKKQKFVAYSVILLPIIYFLLKIESFMHYYIIIMPLLFIFLSTTFDYLLSNKNKLLKISGLIILALIIIESIVFNLSFFELLKIKGGVGGDYGSTFKNTNKEVETKLNIFKNLPDYNEIKLSSFMSLNYVYGYMPLGQILYPQNPTQQRIKYLENKLKKDSLDPRIQQELFAFETKTPVTLQTIDRLRKKSTNVPQYNYIYKEIYSNYLSQNFKREYVSSELGFRFLYPEHWKVERKDSEIIINGDDYIVYIENLGKSDMKVNCVNGKNKCKKHTIEEIIKSIRPY